ncbi:MAG: gamma carbonic anhydrase family protein [Planctomycetota bacterium]
MSDIETDSPAPNHSRHEAIVTASTQWELIDDSAFVANSATVLGHVEMQRESSVWFGAILRGDTEKIVIGQRSNVQDGCIVHCDPGTPCLIGNDVTIGHNAVVHGAIVGDGALIGISATILNGARIGRGAIVAAGALVTENFEIPDGMLVMGSPAKIVKPVREDLAARAIEGTAHYVALAKQYRKAFACG